MLATSRAPLRLAGEHRIAVEPLAAGEASALFALLAHEADPDAQLGDHDAIAAVCTAVDGLPLALELAAARLRLLTLREVADRLGSPAQLRSSAAGLPERHRSLPATVEWSLALLSPAAQRLFARLAVFAGPVSLDIIEAVCGDGIDVVEAGSELVDLALLQRSAVGVGLAPALREIAREHLAGCGEAAALQHTHATTVAAVAEGVGSVMETTRSEANRHRALIAEAWAGAAGFLCGRHAGSGPPNRSPSPTMR